MADILPYLGVERSFAQEELAGQEIVVEELAGLTGADAQKLLKKAGLTARLIGSGETVTGQIPAAGQTVPGGSQVLLYLGERPPELTVEVPDFIGMNRQQASDAAGALGLYISHGSIGDFQPMNINFGIISPLTRRVKGKRNKNAEISARSLAQIDELVKGDLWNAYSY